MTPATTRAAIFEGPDRPLAIRSVPLPRPTGSEILVDVIACTLCGSDLHSIHGRRRVPIPTILGHEILGRVAALGPTAPTLDLARRPLRVGDRVAWAIVASCGECFMCRRHLRQKCEHAVKYGHERFVAGESRGLTGGLAEHCLLAPGTAILRVPDGLPDAVACPASCATATVAAALEAAGSVTGARVLVLGCGMLGLTAIAWARDLAAEAIVAVDADPSRLELAAAFGATVTATPTTAAESVASTTTGRGVDVALELSGAPEALESALATTRLGGSIVLVGAVFPTRPVAIEPERIVRRCLTLRGVHNYQPRHLVAAVEFLSRRPAGPFESLVGDWMPLASVDEVGRLTPGARRLRVGIHP